MHYRIYKNIYVIGGSELSTLYDNNVYLIIADNDILLYDIGSPWGIFRILANMLELGFSPLKVKYLIVSHAHIESSGGGNILRNINKHVKIIVHEPDATKIRQGDVFYTNACEYNTEYPSYSITISIPFNVREHVLYKDPYIAIYHTPGHTKGLVSVIYEDKHSRVALVSDILGPLCDLWGSDYSDLVESLEFIRNFECMKYCTSVTCYSSHEFNSLVDAIKDVRESKLRVKCCSKKSG